MKGKIVLIPFPFTDLTASKRRPALIILERVNDVVVLFISSKTPISLGKHIISIKTTHKEFNHTGLKVDSFVYLDKIATLNKNLILGEIGQIGKKVKSQINKNFKKLFRL